MRLWSAADDVVNRFVALVGESSYRRRLLRVGRGSCVVLVCQGCTNGTARFQTICWSDMDLSMRHACEYGKRIRACDDGFSKVPASPARSAAISADAREGSERA